MIKEFTVGLTIVWAATAIANKNKNQNCQNVTFKV